MNDIVSSIAKVVEEQSTTTIEIANNVNQATEGVHEVNRNVLESVNVFVEITKDVSKVHQASNEITLESHEIKASAESLSRLAKNLDHFVGKLKL